MKGDRFGVFIIAVNSGCGNNRAPKITADVFYDCFRGAFVRFLQKKRCKKNLKKLALKA